MVNDNDDNDGVGVTSIPNVAIATNSNKRLSDSHDNRKFNENTSLSPLSNQTYFAEEKILIPDVDNVCKQ